MSLVVARRTTTYICLTSDTAKQDTDRGIGFFDRNRDRNVYRATHVLKTIIIGKKIVVGWVGEIYFSDYFFRRLWHEPQAPEASFVEELAQQLSRESRGETDFLVATAEDGLTLSEFSNGNKKNRPEASFLGSPNAIRTFNSIAASNRQPKNNVSLRITQTGMLGKIDNLLLGTMNSVMASTILDSRVPEVGGYVISIQFDGSEFHYSLYVDIDAPPKPINAHGWQTVDLGSVQVGTYAYQSLEYDQHGVRIPLVHFLQEGSVFAFNDTSHGTPRPTHFPSNSPLAASLRAKLAAQAPSSSPTESV